MKLCVFISYRFGSMYAALRSIPTNFNAWGTFPKTDGVVFHKKKYFAAQASVALKLGSLIFAASEVIFSGIHVHSVRLAAVLPGIVKRSVKPKGREEEEEEPVQMFAFKIITWIQIELRPIKLPPSFSISESNLCIFGLSHRVLQAETESRNESCARQESAVWMRTN